MLSRLGSSSEDAIAHAQQKDYQVEKEGCVFLCGKCISSGGRRPNRHQTVLLLLFLFSCVCLKCHILVSNQGHLLKKMH